MRIEESLIDFGYVEVGEICEIRDCDEKVFVIKLDEYEGLLNALNLHNNKLIHVEKHVRVRIYPEAYICLT